MTHTTVAVRRGSTRQSAGSDTPRPVLSPALVLLAAVLAISWAGPLIRFTDAPALAVAAWRLTLSTLVILPLLWRNRASLSLLNSRDVTLALVAGAFLAVHFWAWIASLEFTTVASSVVLVSMQPMFVAGLSILFLRERPHALQWAGVLVGIAGAALIGWGDFRGGSAALWGDTLALSGALFVSVYYVIGRELRQKLDLWSYTGLVYGTAAIILLIACVVMPGVELTGYDARDWLVFAALAAGPMMIGHTGINYALRYLPAYLANLAALGEPVGAMLLAWLLPAIRETPTAMGLFGSALVLSGILLGTWRRADEKQSELRSEFK